MKAFNDLGRSTQRMLVGSLIGQRCEIKVRGEGLWMVIPRGIASPVRGVFESLAVFAREDTSDLYVVELARIETLEKISRKG